MRAQMAAIGMAAILGGLLLGGTSALGAGASSPRAGGSVHLVVRLEANNPGEVLIAGALGDYGTTLNINQGGTPNTNGNYSMDTLGKGAFEVNETMLQAKADKTPLMINQSNCSGTSVRNGPRHAARRDRPLQGHQRHTERYRVHWLHRVSLPEREREVGRAVRPVQADCSARNDRGLRYGEVQLDGVA